jgi:hypothetical protein
VIESTIMVSQAALQHAVALEDRVAHVKPNKLRTCSPGLPPLQALPAAQAAPPTSALRRRAQTCARQGAHAGAQHLRARVPPRGAQR